MKAADLKIELPKIKVRKHSGKLTVAHRDRTKYRRTEKHRNQPE